VILTSHVNVVFTILKIIITSNDDKNVNISIFRSFFRTLQFGLQREEEEEEEELKFIVFKFL